MATKKDKIKEYQIKIPVFVTEKEDVNYSYNEATVRVTKMIKAYNNNASKVAFKRRNKTQTKVIQKIECIESSVAESPNQVPVLLLKVTTYNSNLLDGYVEEADGTIKIFNPKTKLGSSHNYILFYPKFTGITPNLQGSWLIFIYVDTNKIDGDIINTAKLVVNKVLKLKHVKVTREDVISKIAKTKVPVFQVRYFGVRNDINGIEDEYLSYLVDSKSKKEKTETYQNIPFGDANFTRTLS